MTRINEINGNQDLSNLKTAYRKAKQENDTQEMSRLKAKATKLMKSNETSTSKTKPNSIEQTSKLSNSKIIQNKDGDLLQLGVQGSNTKPR